MILLSDGVVSDLVRPVDTQRRVGSRSNILVLSQEGGVEAIVGCVPWKPTCRINDALEIALEVDDSGVRFPRTPQVGLEQLRVCFEIRGAIEDTALERQPGSLSRVGFPLSCVSVLGSNDRGFLSNESAELKRDVSITEDEVDGA